jgi:NAD(P)H-nitrite reductase large subunit
VGDGFVANLELGQLAGCRLEHAPELGGWAVVVNQDLETSVPGVFAAGEITGIAGAEKSALEGRLAALCILHRLGRMSARAFAAQSRPLITERKRQQAFARSFDALHAIPAGIVKSLPDETMICRCEDITMGEIRRAIEGGCCTPVAVKRAARVGMGICQGRTCAPLLYEIIAAYTGTPVSRQEPLSARGPVKALPLGTLARPLERI